MRSRYLLALFAALLAAGCRLESWESFESSTAPKRQEAVKGDAYSDGGAADASGGLDPSTPYARGARSVTNEPYPTAYGQPAKGSGLHPGDPTVAGRVGHDITNAPGLKPQPGSYTSQSIRSAR